MTTDLASELKNLWNKIAAEKSAHPDQEIHLRRILPESKCDLFIGIQTPSNHRLFVLSADRSILGKKNILPESKGIITTATVLPSDASDRASLVVTLRDEGFFDIFASLAADAMTHISQFDSPSEAARVLILHLMQWQSFMEQYYEGLSSERVRGLFGELYLLKKLISSNIEFITAWNGFKKTNQDYYFKHAAVEVKTTKGREPTAIRITSERQLDNRSYEHLYIYHASLDVTHGDGMTLPELISQIRSLVSMRGDLLVILNSGLLAAGYLDSHEHKYQDKFVVLNDNFYEVDEKFPKIIEADLSNGVGDVQYSIALSECRHFIADPQQVMEVLSHAE